MKKNLVKPINLFDEIFKTVEVVGVAETSKILQKARHSILALTDVSTEYILKTISEQTNVSIERIIYGTDKTDERKAAVGLCVYFIKRELKYSYSLIKKILKKDEAALSRYNSLILSVNLDCPKCSLDCLIAENLKKLNIIFSENKIKINGRK